MLIYQDTQFPLGKQFCFSYACVCGCAHIDGSARVHMNMHVFCVFSYPLFFNSTANLHTFTIPSLVIATHSILVGQRTAPCGHHLDLEGDMVRSLLW